MTSLPERIEELLANYFHNKPFQELKGGARTDVIVASQAILKEINTARQNELAKTCLAGMPGLSPEQQDFITKRIKEMESK